MLADPDTLQCNSRQPRIVPLSTNGERSPLLFVHDVTGTVDVYYRVVEQLNSDRPCYGIHAPAYTAAADPGLTIEAMASSYLKASRTLLTADGNAVFAGFSLGGMIAYEMARQHADSGGRKLPVLMVDITVSLPRSRLQLTRDTMLNLPAWLLHDGLKSSPWALVQRGIRRVRNVFAPDAPLPSSGIWAEVLAPWPDPEATQVMLAALKKYVPRSTPDPSSFSAGRTGNSLTRAIPLWGGRHTRRTCARTHCRAHTIRGEATRSCQLQSK